MAKEAVNRVPDEFEQLYEQLAPNDHEGWRATYAIEKPGEPAWRVLPVEVLDSDKKWIQQNKGKPWYRKVSETIRDPQTGKSIRRDKHEIDIFALSFKELSPSKQLEATQSIAIAVSELRMATGERRPLDDAFIERTATLIHGAWIERNRTTIEREISERAGSESPEDKAFVERRKAQLLPYSDMWSNDKLTSGQRNYDRNAARLVVAEYRKKHPERAGTIYLSGDRVMVSDSALERIAKAIVPKVLTDTEAEITSVLGTKVLVQFPGDPKGGYMADISEVAPIVLVEK